MTDLLDLEPHIRDVRLMAKIALDQMIKADNGTNEPAIFAAGQVLSMAQNLEKRFDELWQAAR